LNVKVDELIRATNARNDLIGVEDESHGQLDERSQHLLEERAAPEQSRGP
jgi:low affinity Fe/Cu permease